MGSARGEKMRNLIRKTRETIHAWGRDLLNRMVCCVVWLALLLVVAWRLHMFSAIFVALLTAVVVYFLNLLRNLHLEAQLQHAIQTVSHGQVSVAIVPEGGKKYVRCDFHILVRNTTSVPITVREVRLRLAEDSPAQTPLRLKYHKPTYHVMNNDPDEMEGIFLPMGAELPELKVGETYSLFPQPGEFYEIPPQCGAVYGLPGATVRANIKSRLEQVLMIVDYPTIFGRRKVLCVEANPQALGFIQRMLQTTLKQLEQAEAKAKELPPEMRCQSYGRTISSIQHG